MAFCKFSTEYLTNRETGIDNIFFTEFLPSAPAEFCKVYLYGYFLCRNELGQLNNLDEMSKALGATREDILKAFEYWEDKGLVKLMPYEPFEVVFNNIRERAGRAKYSKKKYEGFTAEAQAIIKTRMISLSEYDDYYFFLEESKMQPEAMLMIMKYCTLTKGFGVRKAYILSIAKAWANEGVLTAREVELKMREYDEFDEKVKDILKEMGTKRNAYFEEKQLYKTWVKELNFEHGVIKAAAKHVQLGGLNKLDYMLKNHFALGINSVQGVEEHETRQQENKTLAREVNKMLGVYYENLDPVINNYIIKWLERGYDGATLKKIANYCFLSNVRTLDGMNDVIARFYKMGLLTLQAINKFIASVSVEDSQIKEVFERAGIVRGVTPWDRDAYKTWTHNWNMPKDVIMFAADLSKNKGQSVAYVNKILSTWFDKKVTSLDEAKLQSEVFKTGVEGGKDKSIIHNRKYSKEELEAVFLNIDEIEL